ncbi:MAG: XRE family transcriptional regulator [Bacteroidales bacterium]|nr:XRE family transcriptional regulator [Bacteroidales bacterium]
MDIGIRIWEIVHERGLSVPEFAEAIACTRENAYKIFRKSSLDTALLIRISEVLQHDFFKDLSDCIQIGCRKARE